MPHDEALAKKYLNWALFGDPSERDYDFFRMRDGLISSAVLNDEHRLLYYVRKIFVERDPSELQTLLDTNQGDPGSLIRWTLKMLGIART